MPLDEPNPITPPLSETGAASLSGFVDSADAGARSLADTAVSDPILTFRSLPPMRYPLLYLWFVLVSSLDIVLTWVVLQLGGYEVNPLAAAVISRWGLPGAIGFKFSLMLIVIVLCEVIGRKRDRTARLLAGWSVGVSALAPLYTIGLVALHMPI